MRGNRQIGWCSAAALVVLFLHTATAWGYYFDERREMSLSGFAYTRGTFATQDGLLNQQNTYYAGNLVQHRNFLTLEWRHNLNRLAREFPTIGEAFRFLDIDAFDYYLNMRTEYDGVFQYGPMKIRRMLGGTRLFAPYFDDRSTPTPFDGLYFTPFPRAPWPAGHAPDFPGDVQSLSNRRWMRELRDFNIRLFEWYFNITKGPLFLRVGRQNLSWGETDGFRLLDQINPLDNTFAGFQAALDERRIPLNMLRAQWSFGTVGPIGDLTLEGFYSIDNEQPPVLPTTSVFFWGGEQTNANAAVMVGRTPCGGHFMEQRGIPPYDRDPLFPYGGSGSGPRRGGGCSLRGKGPHSNLEDGRGGVRILGTIHDFTFSLAHYYTYQDLTTVSAPLISPTRDHLRWDLGLPTDSQGRAWADNVVDTPSGKGNAANPWGVDDPVAARVISSGLNTTGRGGVGTVAGGERNIRSTINFERIQITGASLSFPVNALTGMFVGSDNPLYYIYTTLRSEVAYFRNVPVMQAYDNGDGAVAFSRFLGTDLPGLVPGSTAPVYGPGGPLAHQAGRRVTKFKKTNWLAWNVGLDHNLWIRFLNPNNTFVFSAQQFWLHRNGLRNDHDPDRPPSIFNDRDIIAARQRRFTKPVTDPGGNVNCQALNSGSRRGCSAWDLPSQEWLTTLAINSQYYGGNVRPSFTLFYDWSGSYLVQPGFDWTFWDPFRMSIRYNYLEGRGRRGLGGANRKDNVWFELQYLLY